MGKYRKIPITVDAEKITPELLKAKNGSTEFFTANDNKNYKVSYLPDRVLIETIEGTMEGRLGDFIITGAVGEKYPCRGDIFLKTYIPVEEAKEEKIPIKGE